jgi:hypothetical protein
MIGRRAHWLALCLACSAVGCKSAQEKCTESRATGIAAWQAYIDVLEGQKTGAKQLVDEASRTLKTQVDPRIGELAKKASDAKYIGGSDAWLRGYHVAFNDACMKDSECKDLKHSITEATALITDVEERLALALTARKALEDDMTVAQQAATAAIIHPEQPSLKLAQAATQETLATCEGVELAASN